MAIFQLLLHKFHTCHGYSFCQCPHSIANKLIWNSCHIEVTTTVTTKMLKTNYFLKTLWARSYWKCCELRHVADCNLSLTERTNQIYYVCSGNRCLSTRWTLSAARKGLVFVVRNVSATKRPFRMKGARKYWILSQHNNSTVMCKHGAYTQGKWRIQ